MMLNRENLKPHQIRCIEILKSRPSICLILRMGTGKTIITLTMLLDEITKNPGIKIMIVAPKRIAHMTWPDEIAKWEHTKGLTICKLYKGGDEIIEGRNLYITTHDLARKFAWKLQPDIVVLDEASKIKTFGSARSVSWRRYKNKHPDTRFILLTGTPAPKDLMDVWNYAYMIDGGMRLSKYIGSFRMKYCQVDLRVTSGAKVVWAFNPYMKDRLLNKIKDIIVNFEVDGLLPKVTYLNNYIDLPGDIQSQYDNFRKKGILDLPNGFTLVTHDILSRIIKLQQLTGGTLKYKASDPITGKYKDRTWLYHTRKVEALEEMLAEIQGENVMIVINFILEREIILERISGSVSGETKGALDDWNEGKIKYLIVQPQSMGHGLNLQKGGRRIIWYSIPYDLELYEQTCARLIRLGGNEKGVIIHHILAKNTLDIRVKSVLDNKGDVQNEVKKFLEQE